MFMNFLCSYTSPDGSAGYWLFARPLLTKGYWNLWIGPLTSSKVHRPANLASRAQISALSFLLASG